MTQRRPHEKVSNNDGEDGDSKVDDVNENNIKNAVHNEDEVYINTENNNYAESCRYEVAILTMTTMVQNGVENNADSTRMTIALSTKQRRR